MHPDHLQFPYFIQQGNEGAVVDCKYGWLYNTTGLFTSAVTEVRERSHIHDFPESLDQAQICLIIINSATNKPSQFSR